MPHWATHSIDGAELNWDRDSGLNLLRAKPGSTRTAPRVLQIGLLTPCNLSCSFCYRDTSAPSLLTSEFLQDLLPRCADWGVIEVAFGGGEPLLFKGFPALVQTLTRETPLGVHFTTNGTLLTDAVLRQFEGEWPGEIRVSAYPDNHYRSTLQRLRNHRRRFGLNWLVTPRNLNELEVVVRDALHLGASNVMLLGYKGHDPSMILSPAEMARLAVMLQRLEHLPLQLDICWHPYLRDVPQLFKRSDCGAGDEILVITPDRAAQPCSYHHERHPFETFEQLRNIYQDFRARRPVAETGGCTRADFRPGAEPLHPTAIYSWHAHSGNNSGPATIVGRFRTAAEAERAAQALREMAVAHEGFLATQGDDFDLMLATPPLVRFAEAHGFTWPPEEGLWAEESGSGSEILTTAAIDRNVIVYHHYCASLPEQPFATFFAQTGAEDYWSDTSAPTAHLQASGGTPEAIQPLLEYFEDLHRFESDYEAKKAGLSPPWGSVCQDPRLSSDVDNSAELDFSPPQIGADASYLEGRLDLKITFQNSFAGPLALIGYLERAGFAEIEIRFVDRFRTLRSNPTAIPPQTGLFEEFNTPVETLAAMSPDERWQWVFKGAFVNSEAMQVLKQSPPAEIADSGMEAWTEALLEGRADRATGVALDWIRHLPPPHNETWLRDVWQELPRISGAALYDVVTISFDLLPVEEVIRLAHNYTTSAPKLDQEFFNRILYCMELWLDTHTGPYTPEFKSACQELLRALQAKADRPLLFRIFGNAQDRQRATRLQVIRNRLGLAPK